MPTSTQWDEISGSVAPEYAVYSHLQKVSSASELFYMDDTTCRILDLKKELEAGDAKRKGIYTSAFVCELEEQKKVALFFSTNRHAGENLKELLEHRDPSELAAHVMCDALSSNASKTKDLAVILNHCLDHGRRQFVDLLDSFPRVCTHVIDRLGLVYQNDKITKELGMDKWGRLAFHMQRSKPVMDELEVWLEQQLASRQVERNSPLGEAVEYMTSRWQSFCGFFEYAGAPLSNAKCERLVKTTKPHFKNSLFYKTSFGALVGDIKMSLIQTARLAGVNPLAYLTALQSNPDDAELNPELWLPWNYHLNLPSPVVS